MTTIQPGFLLLCLSFVCISETKAGHENFFSDTQSGHKDVPEWVTNNAFEYGFNFGWYIPNNSTANYYNGSSPVHSLEDKIGKDPYTGCLCTYNYTHQEIKDALGGYEFHIMEYPEKMKYNKPVTLGFYAKYNLSYHLGIYFELNYARLEAVDFFSIQTENQPSNGFYPDNIKYYPIKGVEKRYDMNLGMFLSFGEPAMLRPYLELAFNMNNTYVEEQTISVEGTVYSIRNQELAYYHYRDYGVAQGAMLGGGMQFFVNKRYNVYTGVDFFMKKIRLGDFRGANFSSVAPEDRILTYDAYKLNTVLYIRFIFKQFIWKTKELER